jgi:hypothetical protein
LTAFRLGANFRIGRGRHGQDSKQIFPEILAQVMRVALGEDGERLARPAAALSNSGRYADPCCLKAKCAGTVELRTAPAPMSAFFALGELNFLRWPLPMTVRAIRAGKSKSNDTSPLNGPKAGNSQHCRFKLPKPRPTQPNSASLDLRR